MSEAKEVVKGLLSELERYLGPAMFHMPKISRAREWLEKPEQENSKGVNLGKF